MDAVKFLQERKRMFLSGDASLIYLMEDAVDPEVLVRDVESWSAAHPRKTRQSVFLEQYPNAMVEDGVLTIFPRTVMGREAWKKNGCDGISCVDCYHEFWSQEVE